MTINTPVWGTIVFGGVSGGVCWVWGRFLPGANANYVIWAATAVYACLLAGWSGKKRRSLVFPMLLQFMAAFMVPAANAYILLSVGFLAWLRSGVCFNDRFFPAWGRKGVLGAGGLILIALLMPLSATSKGMAVWLFLRSRLAGAHRQAFPQPALAGSCGVAPGSLPALHEVYIYPIR